MYAFVEAAWHIWLTLMPWLLLGAAIAGAMHALLPKDLVRRYLSGRGGVLRAVLLGVPLPLCSCGVIPAGVGLKRQGASNGSSLGFMISTPQTGVDSVLVSGAFLGWPFALFKVLSAGVLGVLGGGLVDRFGGSAPAEPVASSGATGAGSRSLRAAVEHGADILQMIWRWVVVGVFLSAAITVWVPADGLAALASSGVLVPALAALVISLPLYVCATASVPIAAALVAAGLPYSAALVFLVAGPATNVATVGAVYRAFGLRNLLWYLAVLIVGSLLFGVGFDFVLSGTAATAAVEHEHVAWWQQSFGVVGLALMAWFLIDDVRTFWLRRAAAGSGDVAAASAIALESAALESAALESAAPESAAPASAPITVGVEGMTCDGCARRLTRNLQALDGVISVEVDLAANAATVRGSVDEQRVRDAVRAAGFQA